MTAIKYSVMNNKAFCNIFRNSQRSFHTLPKSSGLNNRGYRSFVKITQWHIDLQKSLGFFHKCECHSWGGRMVDSLYYAGWKFSQRCENSFVNCVIHYQMLCDLMRQFTIDINWPSDSCVIACLVHTHVVTVQLSTMSSNRMAAVKVGVGCVDTEASLIDKNCNA